MEHKKIPKRLAVDFDNTLFHCVSFPDVSSVRLMNRLVHWYVRHLSKKGWVIICNTCRKEGDRLDRAKAACHLYKLPIDYFNEQEPTAVEVWGETRKIACDRSLDDTQFGLTGFLLRRFG